MDINGKFKQMHSDMSSNEDTFLKMKTSFQSALGPVNSALLCNKFLQQDCFQEMFSLLWECPAAHKCFVFSGEHPSRKSADISKILREEGNNQYRLTNFDDALKLYNLSIIFAPHPKLPYLREEEEKVESENAYEALACGYANRSAVFYSLAEYKRCITDIDLALKFGYPKLQQSKLLSRKERCLTAQKKPGLKNLSLKMRSVNAKKPPKLTDINPNVPTFSSALKVTTSEKQGRHVIAARDISPGEILAVEESYCSLIRFDHTMMQACSVCLMRCSGQIIPCPDCWIVFCSESCRSQGLAGVHKKECAILPHLRDLDIDDEEICNVVRVIIRTSFMELKKKIPILQKESKDLPSDKLGFDEKGVYDSSDYRSVYHISAYNSRKPNQKLYNLCMYAFMLTKVLQESKTFFVDHMGNEIEPSDEDLKLVGTALLYHFAHESKFFEVSDMKVHPDSSKCDNEGIGAALFPSVWLIRHSCCSNAAHYNIGSVRVVRSIMSIPAGSEVSLLYSEGFQQLPLEARKVMLKARGIDCSCEACENNWPIEMALPEDEFKCIKCSKPVKEEDFTPKCSGCHYIYRGEAADDCSMRFWSMIGEVTQSEESFFAVVSKMALGKSITESDFNDICNFIVKLQNSVTLPSKLLCKTRLAMVQSFYMM